MKKIITLLLIIFIFKNNHSIKMINLYKIFFENKKEFYFLEKSLYLNKFFLINQKNKQHFYYLKELSSLNKFFIKNIYIKK